MNEREGYLNDYLKRIASNIDISESMREKAERSYKAVGKWLGDSDDSDVRIMPQGSFNLGTVIRPISDEDEYDIDLVCLLNDYKDKDEKLIKIRVGNRLKAHSRYSKMLQKEGKRCWTLDYEEFHMDILPCVPNEYKYEEPYHTEIKLTHKEDDGKYTARYSNPYKYHKWFENRMKDQAYEMRKEYSVKNNVEIEKIPIYRIKTPLQQAIQLLKRHRDIMYDSLSESRKDNAPISIIITTLAAHAYNNEDNLFDALKNIILKMHNYIYKDTEGYKIMNPVMGNENFADKWNENELKAKEFFTWLDCAKKDIVEAPFLMEGLHYVSSSLEKAFGKNVVQRSMKEEGDFVRELRENDSLYIDGLKGGIKKESSDTTTKVKGHTFFGN